MICIISFGMYNVSGADPVTPNASPGARASVFGKKTLSGQHISQEEGKQSGFSVRCIKD